MVTFLVVIYLLGFICTLRALYLDDGIELGFLSIVPIFNFIGIFFYFKDEFIGDLSKFKGEKKESPKKPTTYKLIKAVEVVPEKIELDLKKKIITYKLSNGTEEVVEIEQRGMLKCRLAESSGDFPLLESRRFHGHYSHIYPIGKHRLGEIIENAIIPEIYYERGVEEKTFIEVDGEHFRVESYTVKEVDFKREMMYNNFRVIAKEVEA